jgi:hypothetical protein
MIGIEMPSMCQIVLRATTGITKVMSGVNSCSSVKQVEKIPGVMMILQRLSGCRKDNFHLEISI